MRALAGVIVAIDPSLTPGIAVRDAVDVVTVETGQRPPRKCEDRQGYAGSRLWEMLEFYGGSVEAVICETAFIGGYANATRSHSMLEGVIRAWCAHRAVRFIGISPTALKRIASGSGSSDKTKMIATAKYLFPGVPVMDDNQADALCLLHVGLWQLKMLKMASRNIPSAKKPIVKPKRKRVSV